MLNINDIVVKNGAQFKVKEFFSDYDLLTGNPYRVAVLVDNNDKHFADVAENVVLEHYQVNRIGDMIINKVLVAVMYDGIGEEYMEFNINKESDAENIINEYNATGEYCLTLHSIKPDYEYCAE